MGSSFRNMSFELFGTFFHLLLIPFMLFSAAVGLFLASGLRLLRQTLFIAAVGPGLFDRGFERFLTVVHILLMLFMLFCAAVSLFFTSSLRLCR